MPSDAVLYQAAALCLTYPDDDFRARLPLLREAAPQLREFTDHAALTPAPELAAHYLRVFDAGNRHSLYLSRWRRGQVAGRASTTPTGRRSGAHRRGTAGLPARGTGVHRPHRRTGLLTEHRQGLDQLRSRLAAFGTPYASVLDAVCATLPVWLLTVTGCPGPVLPDPVLPGPARRRRSRRPPRPRPPATRPTRCPAGVGVRVLRGALPAGGLGVHRLAHLLADGGELLDAGRAGRSSRRSLPGAASAR